jgi:hypothetical protein
VEPSRAYRPILEQPRQLTPRILKALGALLVAGALAFGIHRFSTRPERVEGHAYAVPPSTDRVVVEVLNGTTTSGLARVGARVLRRAGFDVVYLATAAKVDSTTVLVRRGEVAAGERVRKALGTGRVKAARDSTRHVDVTVILGPDFRGPVEVHP